MALTKKVTTKELKYKFATLPPDLLAPLAASKEKNDHKNKDGKEKRHKDRAEKKDHRKSRKDKSRKRRVRTDTPDASCYPPDAAWMCAAVVTLEPAETCSEPHLP